MLFHLFQDIFSRSKGDTRGLRCAVSSATGIDYLLVASKQARGPDIANLLYTNQTSLQLKNIPLAEHETTLLYDVW